MFARRWDKTGGYFPDYTFNWDEFNAHKASGGTIKDFKNKQLTPLTDDVVLKHLSGQITITRIPLLKMASVILLLCHFRASQFVTATQYSSIPAQGHLLMTSLKS